MNKSVRISVLVAIILLLVGGLIFIIALSNAKFDFTKLSTQKFESNTYKLEENFENIYINVETSNVTLAISNDNQCKVECFEEEKVKHSVKIQNNTLTISAVDNRKWFDYVGINFQTPTIKIYLPKNTYLSLSIANKTGNIDLPNNFTFESIAIVGTTSNVSCFAQITNNIEIETTTGNIVLGSTETKNINLTATTGNITVKDVTCNNLTANNKTRLILLKNVIANENINAKNTTGGVKFENSDGKNIKVKTTTGNVKGTLLTEKLFISKTSTGNISVPETNSGNRCEIITTTGNIYIEIIK